MNPFFSISTAKSKVADRLPGTAAKLIAGTIEQSDQVALNNLQIDDNYIILCVARAKTYCSIEIGVESHDLLYRNPFREPLAQHELEADVVAPKEA